MTDVFQHAATSEYEKSLVDIGKQKTTPAALKKSYQRFDNIIATSIAEAPEKPACKAGCSYCCYYKVEVKAHEVFLIQEHMQKHFSPNQIKNILGEASNNTAQIKTLTQIEHLSTNIKCPFLIDNQCSIYDVRPFRCRSFHAIDVNGCERSFKDPSNFSITTGLIESVALFSNAISQGFEAAAELSGYDSRTYDLNTAITAIFTEPTALKRYRRGKKAFSTAIEINDN